MYEGKNIHFSPLDNKPLCSFSGKLCKQRRLNGYALCLRHVLEDPAAPFRQCTYIARNKQQCTNPIPQSNASQYCTSHMQLLGLLPVSSKSSGKGSKNGLHVMKQPSESCDIQPTIFTAITSNSDNKVKVDPYIFTEPEIKSKPPDLPVNSAIRLMQAAKQQVSLSERNEVVPIARLYPELAEKLEKSDGKALHLICGPNNNSFVMSSPSLVLTGRQTLNNHSLVTGHSKLKDNNHQGQSSRSTVKPDQQSAPVKAENKCQTGPATVIPAVSLQPNGTVALHSPIIGVPWRVPAPNVTAPATTLQSQILSQALRGLLSTPASASNLTQQQSILRTLFPNLLSYASFGTGLSSTTTSVSSGSATVMSSKDKEMQNSTVQPVMIQTTPSVVIPSNCAGTSSSSCKRVKKEPSVCDDSQPSTNAPSFVRPKRFHKDTLECNARRKIRRHSSMKVFATYLSRYEYNCDILPVGIDSSEEDSDLECELPWQRHWSFLSSDDEDRDIDLADDVASNIRRTKLLLQKSKLRRQLYQLQMCHLGNRHLRRRQAAATLEIIEAARRDPDVAADALLETQNLWRRSQQTYQTVRSRATTSERRPCLYKNDDDVACTGVSLPYTNHCLKHIMYNVDQQLFGYCTAKCADGTQCCVPVFDIKHELPVCHQHSSTADEQVNDSLEPKPKKQRKKTKPSALTRPPKKGKKKKQKRLKNYTNQQLLSLENQIEAVEHTISLSTPSYMMPAEPMIACAVITPRSSNPDLQSMRPDVTLAKDPLEEDSLDLVDQLSPDTIERSLGLHLDQATKFLDEHDLHDVLNKIPDEAFDLLTGKSGDYSISANEDEAFARELAEVSKPFDVDSRDTLLMHNSNHSTLRAADCGGNVALPDDELMKQITSVLFNHNSLSPTTLDDFNDSLGDLSSALSSSDVKTISQIMSVSANQLTTECDLLTSSFADVSSTPSKTSFSITTSSVMTTHSAPPLLQNGVTCCVVPVGNSVMQSTTAASASAPLTTVLPTTSLAPRLAVATPQLVIGNRATVPCSSSAAVSSGRCLAGRVPLFIDGMQLRPSPTVVTALTPPVLHIGSLPAWQQLLNSDSSLSLVSTPNTGASGVRRSCPPSSIAASLNAVHNVPAVVKPQWRFVIEQRPLLPPASSVSSVALAGMFPPFAAFCPMPPPVSTLAPVLKMGHPLAQAAALNNGQIPAGGSMSGARMSLLSPSTLLLSSAANSILSSSVVRLSTSSGQTLLLPTSVASASLDHKLLSNS